MSRVEIYNRLKDAVNSGSYDAVAGILKTEVKDGIHAYLCAAAELPPDAVACSSCEALLAQPVERDNFRIMWLLLKYKVYPSADIICSAGYGYSCKPSTPLLKRAVESGSLNDLRQLLSHGADVNAHPRLCIRDLSNQLKLKLCADCDTPLMAAVRRGDIAMIRLLIANGANVAEEMYMYFICLRKTALLTAVCAENKDVITELVTSGADVNQLLGPGETVLHFCFDIDQMIVQLLVELGADPNIAVAYDFTPISLVLERCHILHHTSDAFSARRTLHLMLSVSRDLDAVLQTNRRIVALGEPIKDEFVTLFLQHGARIHYCQMYLTGSPDWAEYLRKSGEIQSERFIELLRAADTDFSGVRQRIASVDKDEWAPLNLVVLDEKLSQPLTLQAWCVISVRRQLRNVRDRGMWASIEKLPLPSVIKDQLKLVIW